MKYRLDLVTNSSSSSFVCDVCGDSEGGWDMSLSDAGMMECQCGHTFCEYHANDELTKEEKIKFMLENAYSEYLGWDRENKQSIERLYTETELFAMSEGDLEDTFNPEGNYDVPALLCPICSMTNYNNDDLLKYLLKVNNTTASEVMEEVRKKYGTYEKFKNFLNN